MEGEKVEMKKAEENEAEASTAKNEDAAPGGEKEVPLLEHQNGGARTNRRARRAGGRTLRRGDGRSILVSGR